MSTDSHSVQGLYRSHHSWLLGWLRRRLNGGDHAPDLAHDTFIRVMTRYDRLQFNEPRALLTTIARGLVIDHYRHTALERAYLDALAALPVDEAPSPETRLLILETLKQVDRMLDGLPVKVRRAFLLSQIDGLTYAEIAAELGVSLSSVQQYMTRAYRSCYAVLEQDD